MSQKNVPKTGFFYGRDCWIGLSFVLFSLVLYFGIIPREVESSGTLAGLQPAFMPNIVAVFLGLVGLALIVGNPSREKSQDEEITWGGLFCPSVWISLGVLFFYPFGAERLGYIVTSVAVLFFFLIYFGCRHKGLMVALSLGVPLGLYWFFAKVMLVMLPRGLFF